jgi:threonine aldolase
VHPLADLEALRALTASAGIALHCDGARIWNAHVASGVPLTDYGRCADVVSVCLSKGLGAPVGSLVLGTRAMVDEARIWRKRLGGGMRQAGVLAAAGRYALDHHLERLADDHARARLLAEACGVDPASVDSNIVVVEAPDAPAVVAAAREHDVLVATVGPHTLRFVTHLDVSGDQAVAAAAVLAKALAEHR